MSRSPLASSFLNAYLDKIDIRRYATQLEVRLLRDLKNRSSFLLTFTTIFYKWRWTIDMRLMAGQIIMFQAPMSLNL